MLLLSFSSSSSSALRETDSNFLSLFYMKLHCDPSTFYNNFLDYMMAGNNAGYSTTRSMANGIQNSRQVLNFFCIKIETQVEHNSRTTWNKKKKIKLFSGKIHIKVWSWLWSVKFMLQKHGMREWKRERERSWGRNIQHKILLCNA